MTYAKFFLVPSKVTNPPSLPRTTSVLKLGQLVILVLSHLQFLNPFCWLVLAIALL